MSGIFGWSYPPGCSGPPDDGDYCEVCKKLDVECICPTCPECGDVGNPDCYPDHMINWYFTFGFNQGYDNGYVKVTVPAGPNDSYHLARATMVKEFGSRWGFQYDEQNFLPQLDKWPLWMLKWIHNL